MTDEVKNNDPEEEESAAVEVEDDQKDMLWALTTPINEMTLEQQIAAISKIRELRKVRISSTKRKSDLDLMLAQLTPEKAASLLKQLEALLAAKQEESQPTEQK